MSKLKFPPEAQEYGLKIELDPFSSALPGQHLISHNGGGIGKAFTQEEADMFYNSYVRGWHEGKREAFREILKATNTRLGGFY